MADRRDGIVAATERFLTWRKRRKLRKREKQKKRHVIIEWIDAFIWAAFVVLLINQYLFQAYEIPSSSMENTLQIRDRIFVNKLIYGPELIPGMLKIPGFPQPGRNRVIIFESPTYISKGPLFDVAQRIIYMLTLSLVDIDRDEQGQPRAHFLIKRAIGMDGDRLRVRRGDVDIKPAGTAEWVPERQLAAYDGVDYTIRRMIRPDDYPAMRASVRASQLELRGVPVHPEDVRLSSSVSAGVGDLYERTAVRNQTMHELLPHESRYRSEYRRYELGWYIPPGWIFPMGDNRDNSKDARYFGPVNLKNVLGKAMFIYWPLGRLGTIR